jgi:uncharacterized protein YuzE
MDESGGGRRFQKWRIATCVWSYWKAAKPSTMRSLTEACAMKIRYFADTDTMLIEFRPAPVAETSDLDENTILDLDDRGNIRSITIEHASKRADAPHFSYEQVAA